ncbi:MAG: hypothetical protein LAT81_12570 [Oceanicaulis sp.]|nr:hypothetical protein [Oceanicaulis sp.]
MKLFSSRATSLAGGGPVKWRQAGETQSRPAAPAAQRNTWLMALVAFILPVPLTLAGAAFLGLAFGISFDAISVTFPPTLVFFELCLSFVVIGNAMRLMQITLGNTLWVAFLVIIRLIGLVVIYFQAVVTLWALGLVLNQEIMLMAMLPPLVGNIPGAETLFNENGIPTWAGLFVTFIVFPALRTWIEQTLSRLFARPVA